MSTHFEYKGYLGSADVDIDGGVVVGRLLFIPDVITYSASLPKDLEAAFREAVDDYLATCKEDGTTPSLPCKGSFNVRIGPERHRAASIAALRTGVTLNEFVCRAIDAATCAPHRVEITVNLSREEVGMTGGDTPTWKSFDVSTH